MLCRNVCNTINGYSKLELLYWLRANTGYIPKWFTGWQLWCPRDNVCSQLTFLVEISGYNYALNYVDYLILLHHPIELVNGSFEYWRTVFSGLNLCNVYKYIMSGYELCLIRDNELSCELLSTDDKLMTVLYVYIYVYIDWFVFILFI